MPDTKISALVEDTTPNAAADWLVSVDVADTSMAATGTTKKVHPNNIRASMALAATGSTQRSIRDKFGEFVSVSDFGAIGNGSTDDTAAVQAAATAVAGTNKTLLIPHGNYRCAALDFTNVRRIKCEGVIKSIITTNQTAVLVGTVGNTNLDMLFGEIEVRVEHNNGVNTGLTGTVGIGVRGAAYCTFRLFAFYFEIGIDVAPKSGVGTQYVANCRFQGLRTYGCFNGLRINTEFTGGNGWVNENIFEGAAVNPTTNNISPGADIGFLMQGVYAANNHVFLKLHVESCATPIKIISGANNLFLWPRLENAGNIQLGDGTDDFKCSRNVIIANYNQSGALPGFVHDAWGPNFVVGPDGFVWRTVVEVNYEDWINNGTTYYNRKVENVSGGKSFTSVTLTAATRSWLLGGSDRGIAYVPVTKGDILRLTTKWTNSPASTVCTIIACDSAKVGLATLSTGDMAYFGTSLDSTFANSTSGTTSSKDIAPSNYPMQRFICVNRSEVAFLSVAMRNQADYQAFRVEKLDTALALNQGYLPNWPQVKFISSLATAPDFPGQIGIVTTGLLMAVAVSATAWNVLTGTATWDPGSIANGAQATTTITVTGAAVGNRVEVKFSLSLNALSLTGYVNAANTVTAVLQNLSGSAIDLASGTVTAYVFSG